VSTFLKKKGLDISPPPIKRYDRYLFTRYIRCDVLRSSQDSVDVTTCLTYKRYVPIGCAKRSGITQAGMHQWVTSALQYMNFGQIDLLCFNLLVGGCVYFWLWNTDRMAVESRRMKSLWWIVGAIRPDCDNSWTICTLFWFVSLVFCQSMYSCLAGGKRTSRKMNSSSINSGFQLQTFMQMKCFNV